MTLTPLARKVLNYLTHNDGSISAREAAADLDITSASLSRRIVELEDFGYNIEHERKVHPVTRKRYTRYMLAPQVTYTVALP